MLMNILKNEHEISKFSIVHSDMKVDKMKPKSSTKNVERMKRIVGDFAKYRPIYYFYCKTRLAEV